jgi:plasmid stability protein
METVMPRIELANVPEELYERLQQRASEHGKSVESEVLGCIERALEKSHPHRAELLERFRLLRKSLEPIYLRDQDIQAAKEAGRA